ncbi:hypothetical protein AYO44_05720 [Planctomycetaceae bacterium SCGC AG-212-F19]|nr:hypothetical protein AYO44_05720 [Planctomycetaceae bacterium SCGC AG-212-F19]
MWISKLRTAVVVGLLMTAWGGPGWLRSEAKAAGPTLVLTLDYRGGLLLRPAAPYMQVYANGQVVVTNPDGTVKHARLTAHQLQQLGVFVVQQNQFLTLSSTQIANAIAAQNPMFAIGDGTTTTISLHVNRATTHVVRVYAADTYLGAFPGIKSLAEFVAIEQRLQQIANTAR